MKLISTKTLIIIYTVVIFATINQQCFAQQQSQDLLGEHINSKIQDALRQGLDLNSAHDITKLVDGAFESFEFTRPWTGVQDTRFLDEVYKKSEISEPISGPQDNTRIFIQKFVKETNSRVPSSSLQSSDDLKKIFNEFINTDDTDSRILSQRPANTFVGSDKKASEGGDRWSWGLSDDDGRSNFRGVSTTTSSPRRRTQPQTIQRQNVAVDPDDYKKYAQYCDELDPTVPDFRAPGKRLTQVKCEEEKWRIWFENEKLKRGLRCTYYRFTKIERENGEIPPYGRGAIGGRAALDGEFPHMVAIGYRSDNGSWSYLCGGSLISPRYVITAAHCMYAPGLIDPTPQIVRLGDTHLGPRPEFEKIFQNPDFGFWQQINIKRRIVHPQYKSPIKYFDIALLELEEDAIYDKYIRSACLWHDNDLTELGTLATLTGWGVIETSTRKTATVLQAADVDIIDSPTCDYFLRSKCNRKWCGVRDHQVCAGKLEGGVDACQGDSGGPLQVKINLGLTPENDPVVLKRLPDFETIKEVNMHYVFGVTSFGIGCAEKNRPGVYTRVSSFLDWIENIVWR